MRFTREVSVLREVPPTSVAAPAPQSVRVIRSPQVSVFALLREIVEGNATLPTSLLTKFRASLDDAALRRSMSPVALSPVPHFPTEVVPITADSDVEVHDQMEHLRAAPAQQALDGLYDDWCAEEVPAIQRVWRDPLERPDSWRHAFARTSLETWRFWSPAWTAARDLWSREVQRVGVAWVRNSTTELLNTLHPKVGYRDGWLHFQGRNPLDIAGRDLVLVPMIAGDEHYLVQRASEGPITIGYPLPGHAALWQSQKLTDSGDLPRRSSAEDGVELLLGPARAAILRAVGTPRTAGQIAADLHYAPSTVTHHCNHLEQSGLIERRRSGQTVVVRRSIRGDQVLDILSGTV